MLYAFDQHIDPVATPEELAVKYHCRYAEHAERFCFIDDEAVLLSRRTLDVVFKFLSRSAKRNDDIRYLREIVDFEIVAPKASKYRLMVWTEKALAFCENHTDAGIEGIVNASWSLDHEALCVGEAPRIHIGVAHLSPEVG